MKICIITLILAYFLQDIILCLLAEEAKRLVS